MQTELETARKTVAELEAKMLEELQEKCKLLGYELVKNGHAPEVKQRRKRRTKQEMLEARAQEQ